MTVTKEALDPCQVALTIEVEPDKVVLAVDRAYREYSKYVSVPGFRKGKAPMSFVRQRVAESDVRQRTAEILVEPAYADALKQESVEPFARPKLELVQLDLTAKPFIFKAVVPLAPEIVLGEYKGLTVERRKYEVTDENVEARLEALRMSVAEFPMAERPAQLGDLIVADLSALVDVRPESAEAQSAVIEIGADNIPGFDEEVIGLSVGDEKTFTLSYPENYPDEELAGEEAEFTIIINEVHEKVVPELNDDLAKKLSFGQVETIDDLRALIRKELELSSSSNALNESDSKLIEQILIHSTIKFPPIMVEAEVEDDAKKLLARLEKAETTLDDYLEEIETTREQLMNSFVRGATRRIEIGLLLGKIAELEDLKLTDAEFAEAIAEVAAQGNTTPAAARAVLESNGGLDGIANRAQAKKVLDFLRSSAIIEETLVPAGTLPEDLEDEEDDDPDDDFIDEDLEEDEDEVEDDETDEESEVEGKSE